MSFGMVVMRGRTRRGEQSRCVSWSWSCDSEQEVISNESELELVDRATRRGEVACERQRECGVQLDGRAKGRMKR